MKSLVDYIYENSGSVEVSFEKLNRCGGILDTKKLKSDISKYDEPYRIPMFMGSKKAPKDWDMLFRILCARVNSDMSYNDMIDIVSEYITNDVDYGVPEKDSFAYNDGEKIWSKSEQKLFIVHLSKPSNRIFFQLKFK